MSGLTYKYRGDIKQVSVRLEELRQEFTESVGFNGESDFTNIRNWLMSEHQLKLVPWQVDYIVYGPTFIAQEI